MPMGRGIGLTSKVMQERSDQILEHLTFGDWAWYAEARIMYGSITPVVAREASN